MQEPKRYLVITPDRLAVGSGPNGDVVINLLDPEQDTGLLGVGLIVRMTPTEAHEFARLIVRKADDAEASSPHRKI